MVSMAISCYYYILTVWSMVGATVTTTTDSPPIRVTMVTYNNRGRLVVVVVGLGLGKINIWLVITGDVHKKAAREPRENLSSFIMPVNEFIFGGYWRNPSDPHSALSVIAHTHGHTHAGARALAELLFITSRDIAKLRQRARACSCAC